MKNRHYLLLVLVLIFSSTLYLLSADFSQALIRGTGIDSVGHFFGFILLTWIFHSILKIPLFNTTVCLVLYAILSEVGQYYLGFRNGEARDVLANVSGIITFIVFKWCYVVLGNRSYR